MTNQESLKKLRKVIRRLQKAYCRMDDIMQEPPFETSKFNFIQEHREKLGDTILGLIKLSKKFS